MWRLLSGCCFVDRRCEKICFWCNKIIGAGKSRLLLSFRPCCSYQTLDFFFERRSHTFVPATPQKPKHRPPIADAARSNSSGVTLKNCLADQENKYRKTEEKASAACWSFVMEGGDEERFHAPHRWPDVRLLPGFSQLSSRWKPVSLVIWSLEFDFLWAGQEQCWGSDGGWGQTSF